MVVDEERIPLNIELGVEVEEKSYTLDVISLSKDSFVNVNFINPNVIAKVENKKPNINVDLEFQKYIPTISISEELKNVLLNISLYEKIKIAKYCKVDKDILWVTPEIWEQIQIYSNTDWNII